MPASEQETITPFRTVKLRNARSHNPSFPCQPEILGPGSARFRPVAPLRPPLQESSDKKDCIISTMQLQDADSGLQPVLRPTQAWGAASRAGWACVEDLWPCRRVAWA